MNRTKKYILAGFIGITILLAMGLGTQAIRHYYLWENSIIYFQYSQKLFPQLEVYTDSWTYHPGDVIEVYANHSKNEHATFLLYDIHESDTIIQQGDIRLFPQTTPRLASSQGAHWELTESIKLEDSSPTGWYVLEIQSPTEKAFTSIFIAPKKGVTTKKIAWMLSTNTWNAYNYWGGQSLYTKNYAHTVSFHRPQLLANPYLENRFTKHQMWYQGANKDKYLAELLRNKNLAFDAYSMDVLHSKDSLFHEYDLIIITTHSEYWTIDMMQHLSSFLDQGGSVMCLSGNTAAHVSELSQAQALLTVHKSQESLWNVFDTTGIKCLGLTNNLASFHSYAPYEVLVDSSWIFDGAGVKNGDLFGEKSDSYDYTHMYKSRFSQLLGLIQKGKMGAASGLEIDVFSEQSPSNWMTVARGKNFLYNGMGEVYPETPADPNLDWDGRGGADLGYYDHPGGGFVFNVGSLSFTGAIPYDTVIQQIIVNVIHRATQP